MARFFKIRDNGGESLQFLPAALEIQQTPPSPLGRAILWAVILFFLAALFWAVIGEVDIVAVAQGKILPSSRIKLIQPLETGVITAIHVSEDARVKQGDVLIELDATATRADRDRLVAEQHATLQDQHRLHTLLQALDTGEVPEKIADSLVHQRIISEWRDYQSRLAEIRQQIKQKQAERAATRERIFQLGATIPLITERADSLKKLLGKNMVSRTRWLELEQLRVQQTREREIQRKLLLANSAGIASLDERKATLKANSRSRWLQALAEVEVRLKVTREELQKAEQRNIRQNLTAPVAGVIKQLSVYTIGGVVTPAQQLMQIVPEGRSLQVEAWVENKDIGFVKEGQIAEIKIDAFPFTRYGTIDGRIESLSDDAVSSEENGLIYSAQVAMDRTTIPVEGKDVNLSPGMRVSVEAKIGKRRIIEYLLAPLLRYRSESIRER